MTKFLRPPAVARILLTILFLLFVIQPMYDPDLGWHLRYGQYFWLHGHVLRDNIISFVWPHYQWVQASWGYDLIVYQLYRGFGFLGLSLTAGMSAYLAFLIVTWPQKRLGLLHLFFLGIVFIALTGPMWGGGIRSVTFSTVLMAIAIVFSDRVCNPEGRRTPAWWIWSMPFLFLIWANLHGGFALGLILLSIQWISSGIVSRIQKVLIHQYKTYGFALAASWITPLFNPWGMRIYEETFRHTTNTNLAGISEWEPLTTMPVTALFTGVIVFFVLALLIHRKNIRLVPAMILLLVCSYLAYSANRFIIILGVIAVYYLARNLPEFHWRFFKHRIVRWTAAFFLIAFVILDIFTTKMFFTLPNPGILTYSWSDYCAYNLYCSENITTIMRANPPEGNGFHPYNYGGYLSWRVPEVKTFIDGRMTAWEENGKTPPVAQGDWIAMPQGPIAFIRYDREYHFTWVIVPTASDITRYLSDLVKSGKWEQKYQDSLYSYFVKKP